MTRGRPRRIVSSARWAAPGASQTISSVGNALLALAAARWMSPSDFGLFALAYTGVLLVSQLVRVAVGEAGLLAVQTADERGRAAPRLLGAAFGLTPVLGLLAFATAAVLGGDIGYALATGAAVCVVATTEVARYALLSLSLVRAAVRLDLTWTFAEFALLAVFQEAVLASPTGLLWCWTLSALIALAPAVAQVVPANPVRAMRHAFANHHWWRLTVNEGLLTGSAYATLAVLAAVAGTGAVGAVRASMLPFQWVQLTVAATWLIILSRQPSAARLRQLSGGLLVALIVAIAALTVAIRLVPDDVGEAILRDNWAPVQDLAIFAAAAFIAFSLAEVAMLRLKANRDTARVLRARIIASCVCLVATMALFARGTPRVALTAMILGHVGAALVATRAPLTRTGRRSVALKFRSTPFED